MLFYKKYVLIEVFWKYISYIWKVLTNLSDPKGSKKLATIATNSSRVQYPWAINIVNGIYDIGFF